MLSYIDKQQETRRMDYERNYRTDHSDFGEPIESFIFSNRRKKGVLVKDEPPWGPSEGTGEDAEVIYVDSFDKAKNIIFLDDLDLRGSADDSFERWMSNRNEYTDLSMEPFQETKLYKTNTDSALLKYHENTHVLNLLKTEKEEEVFADLELFPRSHSRRHPTTMVDLGFLGTSRKEGAHTLEDSTYFDRLDSLDAFTRKETTPFIWSPQTVNGVKYLDLIDHNRKDDREFIYTKVSNDIPTIPKDRISQTNAEIETSERSDQSSQTSVNDKLSGQNKASFKDDFFTNLEKEWKQGQTWQADVPETAKPPILERPRQRARWDDLLLVAPSTQPLVHSSNGDKSSSRRNIFRKQEYELYPKAEVPTVREATIASERRQEQHVEETRVSGVNPVQVPRPPRGAVGGGWVPMVGGDTPGELLPSVAQNTPGPAPSPFQVVVQPGGGATGPSPPPGYRIHARRRHPARRRPPARRQHPARGQPHARRQPHSWQPQVSWYNLIIWLRYRGPGGTGH